MGGAGAPPSLSRRAGVEVLGARTDAWASRAPAMGALGCPAAQTRPGVRWHAARPLKMAGRMHEPVVYPNVTLGEGVVLGPGVVVGLPAQGGEPGQLPTVIGPGSVLRSHTAIYAGVSAGARLNTGHGALIREGNQLVADCSVGRH